MFPTSPLCMLVLSLFPIFWVEWRVPSAQAVAFVVHQFFPRCHPGFSWSASSGALLLAEPLCIQLRDLKRSGRRAVRVQDRTYSCTEPSVCSARRAQCCALRRTQRRGDVDVSPETSAPSGGGPGFWGAYYWSSLFFAAWRAFLFFLPWVHRHPSLTFSLFSVQLIPENRYMTGEWVHACYDTVLYWGLALTRKRTDRCSIHSSKSI